MKVAGLIVSAQHTLSKGMPKPAWTRPSPLNRVPWREGRPKSAVAALLASRLEKSTNPSRGCDLLKALLM